MADHTGHIRLVARADPAVALVIVLRGLGREVRCEEYARGGRIADKGIERGFHLSLAGMGPDRYGKEEIEAAAKDRGVKPRIEIEPRLLEAQFCGGEKILEPVPDPLAGGLDAGNAAGIDET